MPRMTDPTQEQRGVIDRSTPWTQVSHLPGYEWRLNKNGHRETRPIEPVEQGASMEPRKAWRRMKWRCFWWGFFHPFSSYMSQLEYASDRANEFLDKFPHKDSQ